LQYKRYKKGEVFKQREEQSQAGGRQPRANLLKLGVVEGGYRLSLEGIQVALQRFRDVIAAHALSPEFRSLVPQFDPVGTIERISEIVKIGGQASSSEQVSGRLSDISGASQFLASRCPVLAAYALRSGFGAFGGGMSPQQEVTFKALFKLSIFISEKRAVFEQLTLALRNLFKPNVIFELTARQYMFVDNQCLGIVMEEVDKIVMAWEGRAAGQLAGDGAAALMNSADVQRLEAGEIVVSDEIGIKVIDDNEYGRSTVMRKVDEILLKYSGGVKKWKEKEVHLRLSSAISDLCSTVKNLVTEEVRRIAAKNSVDHVKMRAFIAGDTLAEMLMTPVFLTPSVRDAAVRTLNNMIENIPPSDDPPSGSNAGGIRRVG
jgi:hypothetical protein